MKQSANVTSIEALGRFAAALADFQAQMRDTTTLLQLESRRAVEWIENDRMKYWPQQVRRSSDALNEARINLQRCEMAARPEDKRPCTEEKKTLQRARRRLRLCESQVEITRRWSVKIKHEVEEFQAHIAKVLHIVDNDTPRAAAVLKRMADALEKYVARPLGPPAARPPSADSGSSPSANQNESPP